jgi:hypothetical protein
MNTPLETPSPTPSIQGTIGREPVGHACQESGDSGEDPFSPGLQPLVTLIGALIGLLSVSVPLVVVIAGRPSPSDPAIIHGSQSPAGIPSARAGESDRGDPSRMPQ